MKKTFAAIAIFCVALAVGLFAADRWTRRDDGARKYGLFFESEREDEFDVLFFGTSHVLNSIFPMELYRDFGIASYNMGNNSEQLGVTEQVMRLAFQYHKPKVALIDVFYIDRRDDLEWTYGYRHMFLDEIPLSPAKVRAVTSTLPKDYWGEFFVPFTLYHGRWEELLTGNIIKQVDTEPVMMGAEPRVGREVPQPYERTHEATQTELPGTQPLIDMANFCRENGVEPVFLCIPSPATQEEQMNCNSVYALSEQLGVPFLNLLDTDPLVVDFDTDCYDTFSHLNPDGARKVTRYIGAWLSEHYDLPDRREDAAYADWGMRLPEYDAYLDERWGEMSLLD